MTLSTVASLRKGIQHVGAGDSYYSPDGLFLHTKESSSKKESCFAAECSSKCLKHLENIHIFTLKFQIKMTNVKYIAH